MKTTIGRKGQPIESPPLPTQYKNSQQIQFTTPALPLPHALQHQPPDSKLPQKTHTQQSAEFLHS